MANLPGDPGYWGDNYMTYNRPWWSRRTSPTSEDKLGWDDKTNTISGGYTIKGNWVELPSNDIRIRLPDKDEQIQQMQELMDSVRQARDEVAALPTRRPRKAKKVEPTLFPVVPIKTKRRVVLDE